MYFANNKGLLEFDGTSWAVYPIRNAKLRSVKVGPDNKIYVGGLRQFGYFEANKLGGLDYTMLSDSINATAVGDVWNIHTTKERIYFQANHAIYYLENGNLNTVNSQDIYYSNLIEGNLYVARRDGLFVLKGNELVLLTGTSNILNGDNNKVIGIFPYKRQLLIVTSFGGIFVYDNKHLTLMHTQADKFITKSHIFCAAMKDNTLALGSIQDGIMLVDIGGERLEHISINNGLQNNTVLSLMFDKSMNLWAGLDNGIDCIHLQSSIYQFDAAIGSGYASCMYNGKLYLGTNQGVFAADYSDGYGSGEVSSVYGTIGQIYSLSVHKGALFCAGSNALTIIDNSNVYNVPGIRGVWYVKELPGKDELLAATYTGMSLLRKSGGKWNVLKNIVGGDYSSKTLYLEPEAKAVWSANKEGGLFRLQLNNDCDSVVKIKCYNSEELPKGYNVCINKIDDDIVIASRQGLFRYDRKRDKLDRFKALEKKMGGGNGAYTYIMQDSLRNIWFAKGGELRILRYNQLTERYTTNSDEVYLKDCLIEDFESVSIFNNKDAVVGMEDGFTLLKFTDVAEKEPISIQIRRIFTTGVKDSLIYGRSYVPNNISLKIPYNNNSIKIQYNCVNYDNTVVPDYLYRLDGPVSEKWATGGTDFSKEYTSLPEGHYTFHVCAISGDNERVEDSISFDILPPWYRTWWSYIIYLLIAALIVWYTYMRIIGIHRQILLQKELELRCQKLELQKDNEQKSETISMLRDEKLQTELRFKSEELLSATLNVMRKNEMLQSIEKEVNGVIHSIDNEDLTKIRRKMVCLKGLINNNMAHDGDLQTFQDSFDFIHHNFFKILSTMFPTLTKREKMLCAYIKMNLSTKEIAPLLNISPRGVEISRFRLRKKLNLNDGENLAVFLQSIGE